MLFTEAAAAAEDEDEDQNAIDRFFLNRFASDPSAFPLSGDRSVSAFAVFIYFFLLSLLSFDII